MLQEGVQTQNVCVCMEGSMADAELYNKEGWALSYYNSNIVFQLLSISVSESNRSSMVSTAGFESPVCIFFPNVFHFYHLEKLKYNFL